MLGFRKIKNELLLNTIFIIGECKETKRILYHNENCDYLPYSTLVRFSTKLNKAKGFYGKKELFYIINKNLIFLC